MRTSETTTSRTFVNKGKKKRKGSLERVMNFEQALGLRLHKEVAVWKGLEHR